MYNIIYMHDIVLIPGDGVGPEITRAVIRCIAASGVKCNWIEKSIGSTAYEKEGNILPPHVIDAIKQTRYALKGPVITPLGTGFRSVNVTLRQELDLYACVRPCKTFPNILAAQKNVDIVIIRENTEDVYAGIEFESNKDNTQELIAWINTHQKKQISNSAGISIKPITEWASDRIIRYGFEYAKKHNRKKVTVVTKSNIMKFSDGIFMKAGARISKEYPSIHYDHVLIDALCMKLVQGFDFDILVLPNLYGDIVSDLGAGLVGGLGLAPGANIGEKATVYEATHGAAPEFTGKDMLNPAAMLLSAIMMLYDLGESSAAKAIEYAFEKVLAEGKYLTADLLPQDKKRDAVSTTEMTSAIIKNINN